LRSRKEVAILVAENVTKFTAIYDRFLGKITDDMYMELTPEDTVKDL
jgi:hypothetical protein